MANRSYLYCLSNQPTSYADRPESITGLSEWPYAVPLSYRALMSGEPRLCASLISDGFDSEPDDKKSKLYAISSDFETGFGRLRKLESALRPIAAAQAPELQAALDETIEFLQAHRDRFLLLETIELDCMSHDNETALRVCVEEEIETCLRVGAAIDALPPEPDQAAKVLANAASKRSEPPFDVYFGLRLDNDFDNVRDDRTENPIGLYWSDVLYYELWNRSEFQANL